MMLLGWMDSLSAAGLVKEKRVGSFIGCFLMTLNIIDEDDVYVWVVRICEFVYCMNVRYIYVHK